MEEVSALESKGGEEGAENSDYTYVAAVETAPQFSCPVCKNKVRAPLPLPEENTAKINSIVRVSANGMDSFIPGSYL